jgi:phosphocarrier protein
MNEPHGPAEDQPETALVREVEITNKKGLHARASAKFVQTAEQFDASITVTKGSESVGGTSIMGLMMLAAGPGSTVIVKASGKEAAAAIEAVCDLITNRFGEEE